MADAGRRIGVAGTGGSWRGDRRPRVVIVGAGFGGLACARRLEQVLAPEDAQVTLVTPASHSLYLPLLPQVASGVLAAHSVAVPLARVLKRTARMPAGALGIDPVGHRVYVKMITGEDVELPYDRLVLCPGSVTRTFDIPGLAEHARGMKTLRQALALRDHVLVQVESAAASASPMERAARLHFVVVGGGYAGTETAACLQTMTMEAVRRIPGLDPGWVRWTLVDLAPRLMPELGADLGGKAMRMLRGRGMDFRLGLSVSAVDEERVRLTDGTSLPTRTLIWTAGVAASPLVRYVGETDRGRLIVGAHLRVPGRSDVFALGDAAAVPDLVAIRDGSPGAVCPPTAQHAMRQGRVAGDNVAASLRGEPLHAYRHRDLGLAVDLGGSKAVAKPLGVELSGLAAQAVARGYHALAMPSMRSRLRVLGNWFTHELAGHDLLRVDLGMDRAHTIAGYEFTDVYPSPSQLEVIMSGFEGAATGPGGSRALRAEASATSW